MKKRLVIVGASGHGKVVYDIACATNKYSEILFLDDNDRSASFGEKYYGRVERLSELINNCEIIVAIGNSKVREKIMNQYSNADFATLIHPNAVISPSTKIGKGTVVMAGAVVNADSIIGNGVILNTCSSVDHDCIVGDYSHVSVGAHLCGTVKTGVHNWIGAGATVINNIDICSDCYIGAGAVVVKNIETLGTYVGVPARMI